MTDGVEQKKIFSATEGNQWFCRNKKTYDEQKDKKTEIIKLLEFIELVPGKVLEIGCSNGDRLALLKKAFDSECCGIDPSYEAIEDGKEKHPGITLTVGTADSLFYEDGYFDTIIFGFCLYLCDRHDLFKIASEADRCLKNQGTIIIKDFFPNFPYKNKYSHLDGIYSFKMDYSRMFTWNPAYVEVANVVSSQSGFSQRDIPNEKTSVVILRKNEQHAWLEEPFA